MSSDEGRAVGGAGKGARNVRVGKVKNKAPAAVQITAEQLLREAHERQEPTYKPPKQKITDGEELQEYRREKRKGFEDLIRKNRKNLTTWRKYAQWEESQNEIERARSVFERALDEDYRAAAMYIKYAEMEIRLKNVNHARNIWDRAVAILPRMDQLWYKYVFMEEALGNIAGARQVFERWMEWQPDEHAWTAYIKMEKRYGEIDRVRQIFERFIAVHPKVKVWLKYCKFEEELGDIARARAVYERALEFFGDELEDETLFVAFAKFEIRCSEFERARVIYKYALDHLPKSRAQVVYDMYTQFEKQFGDRAGIEDVVVSKRRFHYEELCGGTRRDQIQELKVAPANYDIWFDYLRLEETNGDIPTVRELYERAIAVVPPAKEKRFWRRYIFLWLNYALFEEVDAKDVDRARKVYQLALELVPHKQFTFAKLWLQYAHFEVRRKNLAAARKALGRAIGQCPKDKLFKGYIELELQLREFDRCRVLYEKFLEFNPANVYAWIKYAELENLLEEEERCRGIFELAIGQPLLDMPEVLWKAYIDFEYGNGQYDRTRQLYERLLERTEHVKLVLARTARQVWISYAEMETAILTQSGEESSLDRVRKIYERAEQSLKKRNQSEARVLLLESWAAFEQEHGDDASREAVAKRKPTKVKKRRKITTADGMDAGWEEYYDYIFPMDSTTEQPQLKLLAMAHRWKMQKESRAAATAAAADAAATAAAEVVSSGESEGESARRSAGESV